MGFNKEPDFNIHLDGEVFFNHHPLFDEVFDKFAKQRIFEDIIDIGLEEENSKFFKQFNFIAQFTRGKQMKNLLVPFEDHKEEWKTVVLSTGLYNTFQFFIICQLVLFISKTYPNLSVVLTTGYEDIFKNSVSLKAGMFVDTTETIFEKDTYDWMEKDMNYFSISLDELTLIFRKLIEAMN
jgi:hypothetical protein